MRAFAVVFAAACVFGSMSARLAVAVAGSDEKAIQRAMEHQRKAAEAEIRRQVDAEKKMVEQQNRMIQEQMKAQQKYAETQQKILHEQQKVLQNQQKAATGQPTGPSKNPTPVKPPHITTTQTSTPVYHAARPYYSAGHVYHRTTSHHYRTTTTSRPQLDPQSQALLRLKSSLDHVRMGSPATVAEKTAIKKALMGVVNVPKVPTLTALQTLAGNLADGLANRGASAAQTGPMSMTLMGALNSSELASTDLNEILNEHRSALKLSKVRATEMTPIMESLKLVASQERSRR